VAQAIYSKRLSIGRHGVTLMEVLISIAVVAIGLLGVVALIPVGGQQAQTGARNDRKANVGRRSFREFQVRGMDAAVGNWVIYNTTNMGFEAAFPTLANYHAYLANPLAIWMDPMGYRLAQRAGRPLADAAFVGPSGAPLLNRAALATLLVGPNDAGPACEEIFIAQDDLVFEEPEDNAAAPLQTMLTTVDGNGNSVPGKRYAEGRFSWLATLVPVDPIGNTNADLFRLSTVVISERIKFEQETVLPVNVLSTTENPEIVLSTINEQARVGRWILLAEQYTATPGDGNYAWYRIRGKNDLNLSLAGPAWTSAGGTIVAIIMPNVDNVYTKTIRIRP
jgi:prepilin-type N-terminal cleavage/methylation domain-containing protein